MTLIFGFGGFYLLVRIFSKEEFGAWSLFLVAVGLIEVIRQSLVRNGLIRFMASGAPEDHSNIISGSVFLNLGITVLAIIVIQLGIPLLGSMWNAPELTEPFQIYCITSLILIPYFQAEFLLQANMNFKGVFYCNLARSGSFFLFILIAFLGIIDINLTELALLQLVAAIIGMAVGYVFVKEAFVWPRRIDWQWVKKQFHYGKYSVGTGIGAVLNTSLDQFMIGAFLSKPAVASYNIASRFPNLINIPATVFSSLLFPKSARVDVNDKASLKSLFEQSVGANLAMVLPVIAVISIFPEFIIRIVASETYVDAVPLLRIIVLYSLFAPFGRQFGTILDSSGRPDINFYVTMSSALVNVGLNYFLIKAYGTMGAVYGTLTVIVLTFIVMKTILVRLLGISTMGILRQVKDFYARSWATLLYYLK